MNDYIIVDTDNYLQHHGILGQKWGIRRYQNADGTLTEEGKKKMKDAKDYSKIATKSAVSTATAVVGGNMAKTGINTIKAYKDFAGGWEGLLQLLGGKTIQSVVTLSAGSNTMQVINEYWLNDQGFKDLAVSGLKILGGVPIAAIGAAGLTGAGALAIKKMIEKSKEKKEQKEGNK